MLTRRVFVRDGVAALVAFGLAPRVLARAATGTDGTRRRVLVAIFQRGAADGLNMVVPFGDREYYAFRPTIAIPPPRAGGAGDAALDLDGHFGLHPRLAPLHRFWADRRLAIVHACGSPDPTRSHFDAQDYMETGTPGVKSTPDGWLNRSLAAAGEAIRSPLRAVAIGAQMPRALHGASPALTLAGLDRFGFVGGRAVGGRAAGGRAAGGRAAGGQMTADRVGRAFETAYARSKDPLLRPRAAEAFEAARTVAALDPGRYMPAAGAIYPTSPLGQSLRQISQLIKANVGLEVAFAESNGWDHHVNEGSTTGQLAQRLDDFGRAIAALATDLGDHLADVVILTMTEFGRAAAENGGRGTDHGHGAAMMVIGGDVRGGRVYGRWPGLTAEALFERRDLEVTTDFRDLFAEVASRHLGIGDAGLRTVFPRHAVDPARFPGVLSGRNA